MDLEEEYEKLYRYCYFKVHHQQLAEDITQEAYMRLLSKNYDISKSGRLPYLYTIAHNLCVDEFRKKPCTLIDDAGDIPVPDPSDQIAERTTVNRILETLPEDEQELLLLRYVNEIPVSAICKIVGLSRFAVYRKLSRAEKQLKVKLSKEGFP